MASRNGLSKRELKASQSGGSLNYKTGKVSLPKPIAFKTPTSKLIQAQKSQPVATVTGNKYGPFLPEKKVLVQKPQFRTAESYLPKPTVVNNPLAKYTLPTQKATVKKTSTQKYIEGLGKPDLKFDKLKELSPDGVKQNKVEKRASEIHSAIEAIRPATKQINYAGSVENKNKTDYNKGVIKKPNLTSNQSPLFTRPKGMSKREAGMTGNTIEEANKSKGSLIIGKDIAKNVALGVARLPLTLPTKAMLSVKQGITGKEERFTPTTQTEKFLYGDSPVISAQQSFKSGQRIARNFGLTGNKNTLAGAGLATGSILADFLVGGGKAGKGVTKEIVTSLAKETSESVVKNTLKKFSQSASKLSEDVLDSLSTQIAHASDETEVMALLNNAENSGEQLLKSTDEARTVEQPRETNPAIEDSQIPVARVQEPKLTDSFPQTLDEIPRGDVKVANKIFKDLDERGTEKLYTNVNDGSGELKKVEIGEIDELGNFKERLAEDGRPISEVIDESARNLRAGKGLSVRPESPADGRSTLSQFNKTKRKEGSLFSASKKRLTAQSDAKLAKTAQDTQAQDYLTSKIERLKEDLKNAKNPDTYARISDQLAEETSVLEKYGKMTPEGRRNILERLQREDKGMTDRITEDYQGVRESQFQAPKKEKGSLIKAMESRETRGEKGRLTGSKPVYKGESDLTTKILQDLEGRSTVSRKYIEDATNRGDIKQAERDLIRRILDDEGPEVSVKEFADKVKTELLPLETKNSDLVKANTKDQYANFEKEGDFTPKYESFALPEDLRGKVENYKESIYESPIKTSAGSVHYNYHTDNYFAHSRIEDLGKVTDLRDWEIGQTARGWEVTDKSGKSLGAFQNPKEASDFIKTQRDLVDNKVRRVIEIQSDLFQKGRLEGELADNDTVVLRQLGMEDEYGDLLMNKNRTPQEEARVNEIDKIRKDYASNRNAEVSKLEPYRNTWHERVIREELKKAAQDGKTKVQFPTGETAMKIEGLVNRSDKWVTLDNKVIDGTNIKNGDIITFQNHEGLPHEDKRFLVTKNNGDGTFDAVDSLTAENDGDFYQLLAKKDALDDGRMPSLEELVNTGNLDNESMKYLEKLSEHLSAKDTVDTNNPIYKFYEKTVSKYLNKFGGKVVTDKQGVSWVEVPVSKEMASKPITAFANASGAATGMEFDENGRYKGYNAEKGLFGLGLGVAGMKGIRAVEKGKVGSLMKSRMIPDEIVNNSEAGYQVMTEMELAQAGGRNFIGSGSDLQVVGEKSTFPQWVPSELRLKSVFDPVMKHIKEGTLPASSRQAELYDVVKQEMMRRDGGITKIGVKAPFDPNDIEKANRQLSYVEQGRVKPVEPKKLGILKESQQGRILDEDIRNAVKKDVELRRKANAVQDFIKEDGSVKGSMQRWLRETFKGRAEAQKEALGFKIPENKDNIFKHEAGENYEGRALVQKKFDELFARAEAEGIDLGMKENYVPHVYNESPEQIKKAVAKALEEKGVDESMIKDYLDGGDLPANLAKSLKMSPFFTKERAFDTYAEAMKYGLTPKYDNMSQLVGHYVEKLTEGVANRKLIDDLVKNKQLTALGGGNKMAVNIPGNTGYFANPKVASYLNDYFRNEDALNILQKGVKGAAKVNRGLQNIVLAGGIPKTNVNFFTFGHVIKSLTAGVGNLATLNLRGALPQFKAISNVVRSNFTTPSIKWFNKRVENGIYGKMANEGIDMSNVVGNYKENNRGYIKFFQKTKAKEMFGEGYDRVLSEKTFNSFLPMQMTSLFEDTYKGALKRGLSETEASKLAGDVTKQFSGFSDQLRGKTAEDTLGATFFAPKFREGLINTYWNTIKSLSPHTWKDVSYAQNRRLAVGMAVTFAGYDYVNYKLNGHHIWENPEGKKTELMIPGKDGKVYYTPFMPSQLAFFRNMVEGTGALVTGDLKGATQKYGSNFSMGIKLVTDVIGNKDYFGNEIYDDQAPAREKIRDIAKYVGLSYNHPYIKGIYNLLINSQAEKENIYPKYQEITKLLDNGDKEGADEIIKHLSPLEKEAYYEMKKEKLKPTAQVFSEMMELPIRFSSQGKIASQKYYKTLEESAKVIKAVPEGVERTAKIQEIVSQTPENARKGLLKYLYDNGVSTKGVVGSESKLKAIELNRRLSSMPPEEAGKEYEKIAEEDPKLAENLREVIKESKWNEDDRKMIDMGVENGERARFIDSEIKKLPKEEQAKKYEELLDKKVISQQVAKQLSEMQ